MNCFYLKWAFFNWNDFFLIEMNRSLWNETTCKWCFDWIFFFFFSEINCKKVLRVSFVINKRLLSFWIFKKMWDLLAQKTSWNSIFFRPLGEVYEWQFTVIQDTSGDSLSCIVLTIEHPRVPKMYWVKQDAVGAYIWAWSYCGYDTLNMPCCS